MKKASFLDYKNSSVLSLSVILLLILPFTKAAAANVYSVTNGPWNSGSTWNTGFVPNTSSDNITVGNYVTLNTSLGLSGGAQLIITSSGSLKDVSGAANLNLSNASSFTENGILILAGALSMGNNSSLTINSGATVTTGSTSFNNNATIVIGTGVSYTTGATLFSNNISLSMGSGTLFTVNGDLSMFNHSNSVVNGQIIVNGNLTADNNVTVTGTGSISSTGSMTLYNNASLFGSKASCPTGPCFTSSSNPLPVELIFFKGEQHNNTVQLTWTTASETNNSFFTLEKSSDAITVDAQSILKGAGTTSYAVNYSYIDNNPTPGIIYYRLKQTDFDGKFTYSDFITVNYSVSSVANISIYPNPGKDYFFVESNSAEIRTLAIYDLTGKLLQTQPLQPGKTQINTADLAVGIYNACLSGDNLRINKKLVIAGNNVQ